MTPCLVKASPHSALEYVQVYGAVSLVAGLAAIWSLTLLTLERALVIARAGYTGAGKVPTTPYSNYSET